MKRVLASIVLLLSVVYTFAAESTVLIIPAGDAHEVSKTLSASLREKRYLDYTPIPAGSDKNSFSLRDTYQRLGLTESDADILLYSPSPKEEVSRVYIFRGNYCPTVCNSYLLAVTRLENERVSVKVIAINPRVAVGRVFDIHNFRFGRNWKEVDSNSADLMLLTQHIAGLLGVRNQVANDSPPTIEVSK